MRLAEAEALLKANFDPAQPRNERGRWARDVASGNLSPVRTGGASRRSRSRNPRTWESYPNADFHNRLAIAENSADKPDFGYGEVRQSNGALGRYQMTHAGLLAAGMVNANGNWTGKYGIHSRSQFLAHHEAQEHALPDFLHETERQLRANGAFDYVGRSVNGIVAPFPISRAGLIAAGHKQGARKTRGYLSRVESGGYSSQGLALDPDERAIETRLRTFSDSLYE